MLDNSEVLNNLDEFINTKLNKIAFEGMTQAMLVAERAVKKHTPIDEGRLRASISSKAIKVQKGVEGVVYTNVFYAPYVHEGTGEYAKKGNGRKGGWVYRNKKGKLVFTLGQKPKRYMDKAIESNLKSIRNAYARGAKSAFK